MQMQIEIKRLQRELGITFVYVTHDQEEAMAMSDRIAVMEPAGSSRSGTPTEIYERPRDRVRDGVHRLGLMSFEGRVRASRSRAGGRSRSPASARCAAHAGGLDGWAPPRRVLVRPERVRLSAAPPPRWPRR